MIRAENLTLIRSGRRLLDTVSVDLKPGKVNVIIGPNGAGKSTLMKVLSGEMRAESGSVTYNDVDLPAFTPVQLARLRAVLPQSTQLAFPFTALEIVRMGAVAQGSRMPEEQARRALAKAGLRGFEQRSYNMLSGGEQQRVQFARALAQVPFRWKMVRRGRSSSTSRRPASISATRSPCWKRRATLQAAAGWCSPSCTISILRRNLPINLSSCMAAG